MSRILFLSDIHEPWSHPKAIEHCRRVQDKFKCDRVISAGDEVDFHAFSVKFLANPDLPSPGTELELAIEGLEKWYQAFPDVEVCGSNHGMRVFKKARASGLPARVIKRYEEILHYPKGWNFNLDGIDADGVYFFHGEGVPSRGWVNAAKSLNQSCAFGHLHSRGGVVYSQTRKKRLFALNAGALIDPKAKAFEYGAHCVEKPTLGCGVVIDGEEAYFVPMPTKWL